MAQPSALCFSPSQGTTAQASFNSPPLEEPTMGVRIIPAAYGSPVANPLETGPPLSSERTIWHPRSELWALHVWPLNGSLSEARAPSTRRLYALK